MARMVARAFGNTQKAMATNSDKRLSDKTSASSSGDTHDARDDANDAGYRERVYEIVRRIPDGRVMTYGQLAEILGEGYTPRTVGFVMHAADEATTPWQRVINAQGACSTGRVILPPDKQQRLLEAEGVQFDARGRCDLRRYRWTPEEANEASERKDDERQASLFSE
ncbi:MAG: MGMT family protein [Pyrinomonadaceae bacterium]